jgi:hypothetical protein
MTRSAFAAALAAILCLPSPARAELRRIELTTLGMD